MSNWAYADRNGNERTSDKADTNGGTTYNIKDDDGLGFGGEDNAAFRGGVYKPMGGYLVAGVAVNGVQFADHRYDKAEAVKLADELVADNHTEVEVVSLDGFSSVEFDPTNKPNLRLIT